MGKRYIYSDWTKKWHLVDKGHRDWRDGFTPSQLKKLGKAKAKQIYLGGGFIEKPRTKRKSKPKKRKATKKKMTYTDYTNKIIKAKSMREVNAIKKKAFKNLSKHGERHNIGFFAEQKRLEIQNRNTVHIDDLDLKTRYRKFNGMKFRLFNTAENKRTAKQVKKDLKFYGHKVRTVYNPRKGKYDVYVRKKPGVFYP